MRRPAHRANSISAIAAAESAATVCLLTDWIYGISGGTGSALARTRAAYST